jgi:hypothetical protein
MGATLMPNLPILWHLPWYALCRSIKTFANSIVKGDGKCAAMRWWGRKMREEVKSGGGRNDGFDSLLSIAFVCFF